VKELSASGLADLAGMTEIEVARWRVALRDLLRAARPATADVLRRLLETRQDRSCCADGELLASDLKDERPERI
jgi:hypothetical protein